MAETDADICNLAIARIGQREFIDDLSEDTLAARVCAVVYGQARRAVLAAYPWPFATRRATLALLENEEHPHWEYVYELPEDCLAARYILAASRSPPPDERVPYDTEDSADLGRVLLTDQEDAELAYTYDAENVTRFPPLFVHCLAWKVAADLALSLPAKPDIAVMMERGYMAALAEAGAADARQTQEDPLPDSEIVRVR